MPSSSRRAKKDPLSMTDAADDVINDVDTPANPITTKKKVVDDQPHPPSLPPVGDELKETSADDEDGKLDDEDGKMSASDISAATVANTPHTFNTMLYQLLLHKSQHGSIDNICQTDPKYTQLYNWVETQRKQYKLYLTTTTDSDPSLTNTVFLTDDHVDVLDAIDFQWKVKKDDKLWNQQFKNLLAYKKEHDDVNVPRNYVGMPKLGEWVTEQRRQYKAYMDGKPTPMTAERESKLSGVGFVWKVRERADWNDRYEQLLEFKKETGHCIVPQHFSRNRSLGKWVAKQREQYRFFQECKHSFLTEERIDLLNSVNFVWQVKGRGASKKRKKSSQQLEAEAIMAEKSLVQLEEEEMDSDDKNAAAAIASSVANSIMGSTSSGGVADANASSSMMPSLQDTLMHQNLADINGIAGSQTQTMVDGLTAALKQKSEMGSEHMV